VKAVQQQI